jgi:hypothetical protein
MFKSFLKYSLVASIMISPAIVMADEDNSDATAVEAPAADSQPSVAASATVAGQPAAAIETGNIDKGQKIILKKLKAALNMNGQKLAAMHTADEWTDMFDNGGAGFIKFLIETAPNKEVMWNSPEFKEDMKDIKAFVIQYASDSGNVPSCG